MANGVLINCLEGEWTKIAENRVTGFISLPLASGAFAFKWTSRETGETAPSDLDETDGGLALPLFEDGRREEISSTTLQDFYVWVKNGDDDDVDNVDIRIDLP